mmetsp:Transcript_3788/g.8167  ORF Transcript_3788/g.8167 Transcript_3788/m.8167 type:complete len:217 (+) Transcript_3788:1081-1731(+)
MGHISSTRQRIDRYKDIAVRYYDGVGTAPRVYQPGSRWSDWQCRGPRSRRDPRHASHFGVHPLKTLDAPRRFLVHSPLGKRCHRIHRPACYYSHQGEPDQTHRGVRWFHRHGCSRSSPRGIGPVVGTGFARNSETIRNKGGYDRPSKQSCFRRNLSDLGHAVRQERSSVVGNSIAEGTFQSQRKQTGLPLPTGTNHSLGKQGTKGGAFGIQSIVRQ